MYWLNNLHIFIDPIIRNHDKAFFTRCEQIASEYGLNINVNTSEISLHELPNIFILYNDLGEKSKIVDHNKDILIQYKKNNLDLFSNSNSIEQFFEVDSVKHLDDIWGLIKDSLSVAIIALEQKHIVSCEKKMKGLFAKKNISNFNQDCEKLQVFENDLYRLTNISEIFDYVKESVVRLFQIECELINIASLSSQELSEDNYLPLRYLDDHYLFLHWKSEFKDSARIYIIIMDYLENHQSLNRAKVTSLNWEEIINFIPIPIVQLDDKGQLLVHNKEFSNLNLSIKNCLLLVDNQQLTINRNLYRVVVDESNIEDFIYLFFPVNDFLTSGSSPSSEELGIVSSSIAHELNNPLAGILAAIEVLGLDDLTEDFRQNLDDMKNGVMRCKNLVETFLGFSRGEAIVNSLVPESPFEFSDSLAQAYELVRFRLIENNISINLDFNTKQKFIHKLNPHTISMMFYLIFGEILTSFSHYNLVKRESRLRIDLSFTETENKINLILPEGIELSENFLKSKLLSHLLEIEKLKLELNKNTFNLVYCY